MFKFFLAAVLFMGTAYADDLPTLHQVYEAAQSGRLNDAQRMMDKVLAAHPESGKAHFVEAEILAREGRRADAAAELNTAQRLAPGLPFAKPGAVQELKSIISQGRPARRGFPWGLFLLGVGAIFLIYFMFRSRMSRNAAYMPAGQPYNPGYNPGYGQGYGPGPGYGPTGGGMGSGILSGLATGAAVGAGLVAGEEIAHHLMDGNQNAGTPVADNSWDNMGGQDFGVADNSSWGDDSGFFADNGGNDWS